MTMRSAQIDTGERAKASGAVQAEWVSISSSWRHLPVMTLTCGTVSTAQR